jgi:hypothetical protein
MERQSVGLHSLAGVPIIDLCPIGNIRLTAAECNCEWVSRTSQASGLINSDQTMIAAAGFETSDPTCGFMSQRATFRRTGQGRGRRVTGLRRFECKVSLLDRTLQSCGACAERQGFRAAPTIQAPISGFEPGSSQDRLAAARNPPLNKPGSPLELSRCKSGKGNSRKSS